MTPVSQSALMARVSMMSLPVEAMEELATARCSSETNATNPPH
jgi:hypothetical protein